MEPRPLVRRGRWFGAAAGSARPLVRRGDSGVRRDGPARVSCPRADGNSVRKQQRLSAALEGWSLSALEK